MTGQLVNIRIILYLAAIGLAATPAMAAGDDSGACCHDAVCEIVTDQTDCDAYDGTWLGWGSTCDGDACFTEGGYCVDGWIIDCDEQCAPRSALANGFCDADHTGGDGLYDFFCEQFACDLGDCVPCTDPGDTGACCLEDKSGGNMCIQLTIPECYNWGGNYLGTDMACWEAACDCPAGFVPDCNGVCIPATLLSNGLCDDGVLWTSPIDGVLYSISLDCTDLACDNGTCFGSCEGACCIQAECFTETTAVDCFANGGVFLGTGMECSGNDICYDVIKPIIPTDVRLANPTSDDFDGWYDFSQVQIGSSVSIGGQWRAVAIEGLYRTDGKYSYQGLSAAVYRTGNGDDSGDSIEPDAFMFAEVPANDPSLQPYEVHVDMTEDGELAIIYGGPYAYFFQRTPEGSFPWTIEDFVVLGPTSIIESGCIEKENGTGNAVVALGIPGYNYARIYTRQEGKGEGPGTWTEASVVTGNLYDNWGAYLDIDRWAGNLVVAGSDMGMTELSVYSLGDPSSPQLQDEIDIAGTTWDVSMDGNQLAFLKTTEPWPGWHWSRCNIYEWDGENWSSSGVCANALIPTEIETKRSIAIRDGFLYATNPFANVTAIRSGEVEMFTQMPGTADWEHVASIVPGDSFPAGGFGYDLDVGDAPKGSGRNILVGARWTDDAGEDSGRAYGTVTNSNIWLNPLGGSATDPDNWMWSVPEDESTYMGMQSAYTIISYGTFPGSDMAIGPNTVTLNFAPAAEDERGPTGTIPGTVTIRGIETLPATLVLPWGNLSSNSVFIGPENQPGRLVVEQANIDIQGRLEFGPSGTLQIELQEGSKFAPVSCGPANLGGTLECTGVHSEYPRAGDVIPLISVAGTQKLGWNERFDLALLPGLPDGLYYRLVYDYGSGVRGQGPFNVNLVVDTLASLAGLGDPDNFSLSGLAVDLVVDDFGSIGGGNDGYDDVAIVIDGTPGQLAVFINDGTGDLVQQAVYNTGNEPSAVTSGDLDDDGTIDLAVTNAADDTIMTWSNPSADPTALVFDGSVGTGDNPSDIISLDIDNDLDDDLVVTCAGDSVPDVNGNFYGEIRFYETTSVSARTTLQLAQNLDSGGAPSGIKPGDVDPGGDKDEDVLIGFGATNTVGQGRNTSAALGGVAWSIIGDFPVGASPSEPQPADLDGDGFLDVFVSNLDGSSISLLRGTGSGAYDPAITTVLPSAPTSMTLLDHDLDGDLDLAMILENEDGEREIRVYRNDTLAGESLLLTLTDALDTGLNPILVGHGDLDADGYDDLVSINQEVSARGSGWLLKVRSGDDGNVACEGDTDGSGTVDVIDLLAVISAWGPCSGCNEDIDGNDAVDVLDLLAVISAWGECP